MLDIQKLAAEMGLSCITTYKLDALKSVRRKNECDDMTNLASEKVNNGDTVQSSDVMKLQMEKNAPVASEGLNADKTFNKTGRRI